MSIRSLLAPLLVAAALTAGCAHLVPDTGDKVVDNRLRAMSQASTWGHPDEFGQFAGMRSYAGGDYKDAMNYFRQGARYADKLSQLSIGLMYLNGKGVTADPVEAWAWIAVAAERNYPQFVATRDRIWATLDAAQRERALAAEKTVAATYGDAVAKPRMAKELDYWRTQITGSRTGHVSAGLRHVAARADCGASRADAPMAGCGGNIYADWRMVPKLYFENQDAQWNGSVTVGSVEDLQTKGRTPNPAPASSTH